MRTDPELTVKLAKAIGGELVEREDEDRADGVVDGALRDALGAHQPLIALRDALRSDACFREWVRKVEADEATIEEVASAYAWRDGRPRLVVYEIVRRIVEMDGDLTLRVLNFPPVPSAALDAPSEAPRWRRIGNWQEAAELLVRLGSRRCLACGEPLSSRPRRPGQAAPRTRRGERRYCQRHEGLDRHEEWHGRAEQEAILGLLSAVGDLMGVRGPGIRRERAVLTAQLESSSSR